MSDNRSKKAKRIHGTETAIERQKRIAKLAGVTQYLDQPHRYAKHHAMNCGDPKCVMCGNPRKFFNEKTMQEKRFEQGYKLDTRNS
jgi:hypothetical protein